MDDFDLDSDAVRANPYPAYASLREAGHAHRDPRTGDWFVGRYADVRQVLRDSEDFSHRIAGFEPTLQGADGEAHRKVRRLLQPGFAPNVILALEPDVRALADRVVAGLAGRGRCEFMSEAAFVVTATVVGWMLDDRGTTPAEQRRRAEEIIHQAPRRLRHEPTGGNDAPEIPTELARIDAYLRELLQRAVRGETSGWLVDLLAQHHREGRITEKAFADIGLLLIAGATETTASLMGNAILLLARDPALQQRLRDDPGLIEAFVEEVLRFEAPVQRRPRIATREAAVGDAVLPEGATVFALIGAANRDPEVFPDPDSFRLDREANRHLSFGAGAHLCPGALLGRIETRALVGAVLRDLPPFRLASPEAPVPQPASLSIRGPRRLEIVFDGVATPDRNA